MTINLIPNTNFNIHPAERIAPFKPYFFSSINKKLENLKEQGIDIIRLDMGSPDLPPADFIIDALVEAARQPNSHGYMPHIGTKTYLEAVSTYYKHRFQVELNPRHEILALLGSKEGIFNFGQALTNPGDINLVPDPSYPVYYASTIIAGGQVHPMPLLSENGFQPDIEKIPTTLLSKTRVLWLNYPNNPTGAFIDLENLEKIVHLARKNNIVIAYDNPYADICFDSFQAPSILQVPGAKEITVEFNSLSKTYNMPGWRIGMAVGNPMLLSYLQNYKSQIDSSHFGAIFAAGTAALTGDQSWIISRNQIYQKRRDIILDCIRQMGFTAETPKATIYIWAKLPGGITDDTQFCSQLLENTGVSITPGSIYGKQGKGYIRISLGVATDRLETAVTLIKDWVLQSNFSL